MADDPNPPSEVKFDPNSRKRVSAGLRATEQTLDEIARRPIEMHQEAEATISRFPPYSAIISVVLGAFLVICAVPYAASWNENLWNGWKKRIADVRTSDEIRALPRGHNWLPAAVITPFALTAIGLGIYSRRHRLGVAGLLVGSLALAESAGAACFYEWSDGSTRQTLAKAHDVRMAEEQKRLLLEQAQTRARLAAEQKKLEEANRLAAEEQRKRQLQEEEAARERARAAVDASFRAQLERQRQEDERQKLEKKRLAEEKERARQAELERQLGDLDRTRIEYEQKLAQLKQRLDTLTNQHDTQAASIATLEKAIEGCRKCTEKNEKLLETLTGKEEEQNGIIQSADHYLKILQDQRAGLQKQSGAVNFNDAMARVNESEAKTNKRKNDALAALRDIEAQRQSIRGQIDLAGGTLKRDEDAMDNLVLSNEDLDKQIAAVETEQAETEKAIEVLKVKAEKLKADFAQGAPKP